MYDVIIIGAGVAGLAAAMYSGRFEMKTLVIGETIGGTLILTDSVENYPGFKKISGMELVNKLKEHALDYNIELREDKVKSVKKSGSKFIVSTKEKKFEAKSIIISTGTEFKKLGVPEEEEFKNKGVHYCALCDGYFYKEKIIAVIGGSDSAAKDALLLSKYGKKVYMIYRGEEIRAEPINYERIMKTNKIEIITKTNVTKINGDKSVKSIELDNPYKGKKELNVDGIFVAIGHNPSNQFAKELGVELNEKGYIKIDREGKTNVAGVFAAGDIVDSKWKQAITGVAEGVSASYSAYQYVQGK